MPKIIVKRSNELIVHRGSCCKVLVDGENVIELNNAESSMIEIPAGEHTIMAVIILGKGLPEISSASNMGAIMPSRTLPGYNSSSALSFNVAENEEITFEISALIYPYILLLGILIAAIMINYFLLIGVLYFGFQLYYSRSNYLTIKVRR